MIRLVFLNVCWGLNYSSIGNDYEKMLVRCVVPSLSDGMFGTMKVRQSTVLNILKLSLKYDRGVLQGDLGALSSICFYDAACQTSKYDPINLQLRLSSNTGFYIKCMYLLIKDISIQRHSRRVSNVRLDFTQARNGKRLCSNGLLTP